MISNKFNMLFCNTQYECYVKLLSCCEHKFNVISSLCDTIIHKPCERSFDIMKHSIIESGYMANHRSLVINYLSNIIRLIDQLSNIHHFHTLNLTNIIFDTVDISYQLNYEETDSWEFLYYFQSNLFSLYQNINIVKCIFVMQWSSSQPSRSVDRKRDNDFLMLFRCSNCWLAA